MTWQAGSLEDEHERSGGHDTLIPGCGLCSGELAPSESVSDWPPGTLEEEHERVGGHEAVIPDCGLCAAG